MTHVRVPERDQPGWNAGYLAGEAERVALATANSELRRQVRVLGGRLRAAYGMINSRAPVHEPDNPDKGIM